MTIFKKLKFLHLFLNSSFNCGTINSAFSVDSELPLTSLNSLATSTTTLATLRLQPHGLLQDQQHRLYSLQPHQEVRLPSEDDRSLGPTTIARSNSFRFATGPTDFDSTAIILQNAEPIDSLRGQRTSNDDLYSRPLTEVARLESKLEPSVGDGATPNQGEGVTSTGTSLFEPMTGAAGLEVGERSSSRASTLSLGETVILFDSDATSTEELTAAGNDDILTNGSGQLEARNINIVLPPETVSGGNNINADNRMVTLEIDTTTSVI